MAKGDISKQMCKRGLINIIWWQKARRRAVEDERGKRSLLMQNI